MPHPDPNSPRPPLVPFALFSTATLQSVSQISSFFSISNECKKWHKSDRLYVFVVLRERRGNDGSQLETRLKWELGWSHFQTVLKLYMHYLCALFLMNAITFLNFYILSAKNKSLIWCNAPPSVSVRRTEHLIVFINQSLWIIKIRLIKKKTLCKQTRKCCQGNVIANLPC